MRDLPNPTFPVSQGLPDHRRRLLRRDMEQTQTDRKTPDLRVSWARTEEEIIEAQKLRYSVFAEEMGAHLHTRHPGVDEDIFDPYCDHLLVRDAASLQVVGTYRVMQPSEAKRMGCLYSDSEFDLVRLHHLRPKMLELGRSCVHPDYRNGAVIMALWQGLAHYMLKHGLECMLGCASVSMADGGHFAASLYQQLAQTALAPIEYHAAPRLSLPVDELDCTLQVEAPALVKGYIRLGAKICGAPAWDPDFNTADFLMLMRLSDMNSRYKRHFFGQK